MAGRSRLLWLLSQQSQDVGAARKPRGSATHQEVLADHRGGTPSLLHPSEAGLYSLPVFVDNVSLGRMGLFHDEKAAQTFIMTVFYPMKGYRNRNLGPTTAKPGLLLSSCLPNAQSHHDIGQPEGSRDSWLPVSSTPSCAQWKPSTAPRS